MLRAGTFGNQVIHIRFAKVTEQKFTRQLSYAHFQEKKCHSNFLSCRENTMNALHAIFVHFKDEVILEQYIRIGFLKNCKLALFLH